MHPRLAFLSISRCRYVKETGNFNGISIDFKLLYHLCTTLSLSSSFKRRAVYSIGINWIESVFFSDAALCIWLPFCSICLALHLDQKHDFSIILALCTNLPLFWLLFLWLIFYRLTHVCLLFSITVVRFQSCMVCRTVFRLVYIIIDVLWIISLVGFLFNFHRVYQHDHYFMFMKFVLNAGLK